MKKTVICSLLVFMLSPCHASPLGKEAFDTVSISAQEASEDEQPGILHFNGDFMMQSHDWQVTSAQATVYGSPNNPDRIYLEGSPARFIVEQLNNVEQGPVEATARVVEYQRAANTLKLSGDATLMLGKEIIRSTTIEYDISSNRYQAGGADRVLIEIPPAD
jgi:lipopolysaccharide export system protein LptA